MKGGLNWEVSSSSLVTHAVETYLKAALVVCFSFRWTKGAGDGVGVVVLEELESRELVDLSGYLKFWVNNEYAEWMILTTDECDDDRGDDDDDYYYDMYD